MNTRQCSTTAFAAAILTLVSLGCSIDAGGPATSPLTAPQSLAETVTRDGGEWVGPAGGVVEEGGVQLEIPPGALTAESRIAIHRQADGSVELTPDGQRFKLPVRLHLATPVGCTAAACSIQWYNPASGVWVAIPSNPESAGRVAPLAHFSSYRILELVN